MNNSTYFERGYTFDEYTKMFEEAVLEKRTSGPNQDEMYVRYTELNWTRWSRIWKHGVLNEDLAKAIETSTNVWKVLVITEFWCGDAAQNLPMIAKALARNLGIEVRYVFRDENLELMDRYLTNGGRSIPKIIVMDENYHELFTWGARPVAAHEELMRLKGDGLEFEDILTQMQKWYNADKSQSLQKEIAEWFK